MKKYIPKIVITLLCGLLMAGIVYAANTFPTSLNNWSSGDIIESDWANALEDKIGVDNSTVTSSIDYLIKSTSSDLGSIANISGSKGMLIYYDGDVWQGLATGTSDYVLKATDTSPYIAYAPDSNTTYSAGTLLSLVGTTFNVNDDLSQYDNSTSSFLTSVAYADLTGNPSDVITAGTLIDWNGDTLNVNDDLSQYDNNTSSFLTSETDPIWNASSGDYVAWADASTTNWDTAYGIVNSSSSNWDTTYGIVNSSSSNWDTAYSWGDHSTYSYATTGQLHDAVTLDTTSYDYLSLSTQQITLGQIDISDDTNLAGGTHLTLSDDTLNLDSEIYTESFSITVRNATATTDVAKHIVPNAITITKVICEGEGGTGDIQLDEEGTDIMTAALTCANGSKASTTSFTNSGIAAQTWIDLDIDSLSSADNLFITVLYEIND